MKRILILVPLVVLSLAGTAGAHQACTFGLFIGDGAAYEQPAPHCEGPTDVVQVQASNSSDILLTATGEVWTRGDNRAGQLGNGTFTSSASWVKAAIPAGRFIVSIGQVRNSSIAIDSKGRVFAWGEGTTGSLCIRTPSTGIALPTEVTSLAPYDIVAESGGGAHSMWLTSLGTVYACGVKGPSGLPESEKGPAETPMQVPGLAHVVEVQGSGASCAREESGAVYCWGANEQGQIGVGYKSENVQTPTKVPLPGPASQIYQGGDNGSNGSSGAIVENQLYTWGCDTHQNCKTEDHLTPYATGLDYGSIAIDAQGTFGVDGEELSAFGNGAHGSLGSGSNAPVPVVTPVPLLAGSSQVSAVAEAGVLLN